MKSTPFDPDRDHDLRAAFAAGLSDADIAVQLGYTRRQIKDRRSRIGLRDADRPRKIGCTDPGRKWTSACDMELAAHCESGMSDEQIAVIMSRTSRSIEHRRHKLGLPLHYRRWTEACDRRLLSMHRSGVADEQIATELNRSVLSIALRRRKLGIPRSRSDERVVSLGRSPIGRLRRLMYVATDGSVLDPLRVSSDLLSGGRWAGFVVRGERREAI